ncbi:putative membrane protein [Aerococcus sp. 150760007-1]
MDLITQLLLYIGAFTLLVIVGTFIFIMLNTIVDVIDEQQQARERDKE